MIRRLTILAVIVVVQFGLFEAGLRLEAGSEAGPVFQQIFMPDARIGHRLRPGAAIRFTTREFSTDIEINDQGVRDEPIGPKGPDERRVLVLGDSIALAVQVPLHETFAKALERRLNARADAVRYRVINAGVQGYGPVEEFLFFRDVLAGVEPDLVVVTTFVPNDAVEAAATMWRLSGDVTEAERQQEEADRWLRRLVRRSMVLQIVRIRANALLDRLGRTPVPERPVLSYAEVPPEDVRRGFDQAREVIERIARLASERGARTAVALVPARFQLDPDEFDRLRAVVEPRGVRLRMDGATERFRRALEGAPVPVLDLLPAYRADASPGAIFFAGTVHLTTHGHEVTAAALERFLAAHALLPPD